MIQIIKAELSDYFSRYYAEFALICQVFDTTNDGFYPDAKQISHLLTGHLHSEGFVWASAFVFEIIYEGQYTVLGGMA